MSTKEEEQENKLPSSGVGQDNESRQRVGERREEESDGNCRGSYLRGRGSYLHKQRKRGAWINSDRNIPQRAK